MTLTRLGQSNTLLLCALKTHHRLADHHALTQQEPRLRDKTRLQVRSHGRSESSTGKNIRSNRGQRNEIRVIRSPALARQKRCHLFDGVA